MNTLNNIFNNYNNNNILVRNGSSEHQHNNIEIDNNTFITTDLKLHDDISNYANNSDGNSSSEINCLHKIYISSQHATA